ncbi:PREDICTED: protein-lysine N-methyltransferase METTL10 isoform X3 [Condylura cristata]|uniref:protein-lysine N-methyltransferase METTL10 isoform X3 n=1 Tax=Condylura cristata TaxID=143302 RepID=UPI0006430C37|nr:PREDICTED: protein-lysine N-methyltransferase METTL10 isoform X3 [Condylura cristata]
MSAGAGGGGAAPEARSRGRSPGAEGFAPSALGTREHWDAVYERELQTFQEYGDTGEIWFGEESMSRLIRWMQKQKIPLDASVLDIGTGNGVFLVELVGFELFEELPTPTFSFGGRSGNSVAALVFQKS